MAARTLYFLDFYLPNEGEPETALEIGVLRYVPGESRPSVFLHTFIQPAAPMRVRWSNAYGQGIHREFFQGARGRALPTLQELELRDFLKDKSVICFNPQLEPFKTFVRSAHDVHGIVETWLEVHKGNETAVKLLKPSQMLNYIGLADSDNSNTRYTALLCRLQSLIAIWCYLDDYKQSRRHKQEAISGIYFSPVWPLADVREDYLEALSRAQSFAQVQPAVLKSVFSDALPDYLDWRQLQVFGHDWIFRRRQSRSASTLSTKVNSMADLIFNKVLSMQMKLWVLIFYAIYDHKTDYACEIALKNGEYSALPSAITDDFSFFIIGHLDDFLDSEQKRTLLKSIIHAVMGEQARSNFEHYDFDVLYKKYSQDRESSLEFHYAKPNGCAQRCFKEISRHNEGVLYRRYEIAGPEHDRALCVDYVNELFRAFIREVQDPFAEVWTPGPLRRWIEYITGFDWQELKRGEMPGEDRELTRSRTFVRELIANESRPWKSELKRHLVETVEAVNQNPDGAYHNAFTFQTMSVEIDVQEKTKSSLLSRIFNF